MSDMHGIEKRRRVRKDGTARVTYRVRWVDAGIAEARQQRGGRGLT